MGAVVAVKERGYSVDLRPCKSCGTFPRPRLSVRPMKPQRVMKRSP